MTAPEPAVPDVRLSPDGTLWRRLGTGRWAMLLVGGARTVEPPPADAVRLVPEPAPAPSPRLIYDDLGHFHGVGDSACEHRTVGSHRAWCHDCREWCYPSDPCPRCQLVLAPVPETQETPDEC